MSNIAAFGKTCVHAKSHHKEPHLYGAIDFQLGSCTLPVLPEENNGEFMFLRELSLPFMILFETTCMPQVARTYIRRQFGVSSNSYFNHVPTILGDR